MMNAKPVKNKITDIDLSITEKKPFRFDGDDNRIVYVNVADMGIIGRAEELLPKIDDVLKSYYSDEDTELSDAEALTKYAEKQKAADAEIRELIDELFNAPISDAAAPDGSMLDMFNGTFRYEIILDAMSDQYIANLSAELKKMDAKLKQHTKKYTKGKK